jgi:energy-coupling factor transport system ATP-binding protein
MRKYSLSKDFSLDTMDIVIAVLLGVSQAVVEIFGLLGFLERTVWATGPVGFAIYAFYNGTTWILIYIGAYLRKRAMVPVLAVTVTALVRWFSGDPDGPILLFYALFPVSFGVLVFPLLRWNGRALLYVLAVAVTSVANQCALFIGQGGFQLADGTFWALTSMGIASVGGSIWGLITWHLGKSLTVAGVSAVDTPPSIAETEPVQIQNAILLCETEEMDFVLVVRDYDFWFDKKDHGQIDRAQLKGINLNLKKKSINLLIGESGSGKSTLALNILGVYPDYYGGAYQGAIFIKSQGGKKLVERSALLSLDRFKAVNIVFQNPEDQMVCLTVEEEVAFALENYGLSESEMIKEIDNALAWVGLESSRAKDVNSLSAGEKQRLILASMIALKPSILILDEPTSNLDPVGKTEILRLIQRLRDEFSLTIILIEHEVDKVFPIIDEIHLIKDNEIQGPYSPKAFLDTFKLESRDGLGLWIPQCSELDLLLREQKISLTGDISIEPNDFITKVSANKIYKNGSSVNSQLISKEPVSDLVLSLKDISFKDLLTRIDIDMHKGEMIALTGANGSGKSLLGSIMAGLVDAYSGSINLYGNNIREIPFEILMQQISFIFQVPEKQFVKASVYEEIEHGLIIHGLQSSELSKRVEEVLTMVNLLDRKDASPYILSHGQKRRLSVACMIVSNPKIIILDEPTFGQDHRQAMHLMMLLNNLAMQGTLVIFITNDMKIVGEFASRVITLSRTIVFDGYPATLFSSDKILEDCSLEPTALYQIADTLFGVKATKQEAIMKLFKESLGG